MKRIAIVGSGVAGLVAAYLLRRRHDVTLFEADDRLGGHAHTISVSRSAGDFHVDTGFVVFNEVAYPNFIRLLDELGVASQASDMSFSVQCQASGLEYASHCLFAQRSNYFRPRFYGMLRDISRFFREAREVRDAAYDEMTLGDYFAHRRYSKSFIEDHLVPMGSAIWSAQPGAFDRFPVQHFVNFFDNHGFLQLRNRSAWRTVTGGSRQYVDAIARHLEGAVRLSSPVLGVRRDADQVSIRTPAGSDVFDEVVLAVHSDQALAMLEDPSDDEARVLGAIGYQANDTVLHTDEKLLPTNRRAWASWNYWRPRNAGPTSVQVTYNMNRLQCLDADATFCVTLNRTGEIDQSHVIRELSYAHPEYDREAFDAQKEWHLISGRRRTHYCGAYWGYGFHEDGVKSGLAVAKSLGEDW
ncbi:MAG: NAD(P)/FAD-dependent oxidoreductase [Phycisphaerae bacterium]